jgi:uncharacterized protein involved in outer membrane biogenesis
MPGVLQQLLERLVRTLRRRRARALVAVVILAASVRIALPAVLRPMLVSQADAALVGRIELRDLDLSLMRGGATLYGVSLHASERTGDGSNTPDTRQGQVPPIFTAERLYAQISWLSLVTRTLRVEELELEAFTVHLERLPDGLVLPQPRPGEAPPETAPPSEPAGETPSGWSFAADSVRLRDGRITLRDHTTVDPPQQIDLALRDVSAELLTLSGDAARGEPGRLALRAAIGDGTLGIDALLETRASGPAVTTTLEVASLSIQSARPYVADLGWSDLAGRLDAKLVHTFEADGAHRVTGAASLSDVAVSVPSLGTPVLAWRALRVELHAIDLVKQDAAIARVALDGLRLPVDPAAAPPLPVLTPRAGAAASPRGVAAGPRAAELDAAAAPGTTVAPPSATSIARESLETLPTADALAPRAEPPGADSAPERPWTWSVGEIDVTDASVALLGSGDLVSLGLGAQIREVSSDLAKPWPIGVTLTHGAGAASLDGSVALAPLRFDATLAVDRFELQRLLGRSAPWLSPGAASAVSAVRSATLRADLVLRLASPAQDAQETGNSADAGEVADLRVAGVVGLAGLDIAHRVAPDAPDAFAAGWQDLEIVLREVRVPRAAGPSDPSAPPITVDVERIVLSTPSARVTRTERGLVLPGATPSDSASASESLYAAEPSTDAAERDASSGIDAANTAGAPARGVAVTVGEVRIESARAEISDTSVVPPFRSTLDRLDVRASALRWPEPAADRVEVDLAGLGGATLAARGSVNARDSKIAVRLDTLPLAQLSGYLASTGYALTSGSLSIRTEAVLAAAAFDVSNDLVVAELGIGGADGAAAFQQTFGIPLSLALALLTDIDGKLTLSVPLAGDRTGTRVGLTSVVAQALRKSLVGALTSPLKLVGAVVRDGKVETLAPAPIAFVPGTASVAPAGEARIQELATLLRTAPGVSVTLGGQLSADDARALRVQAVLADLRELAARVPLDPGDVRAIVRGYLEARQTAAPPPPLAQEAAAWLEERVAAAFVASDALDGLATSRAVAVRDRLAGAEGVVAERITVGAATRDAPASGVAVSVAATRVPAR